jgi:hypothetical protein
LPFLPSDTALLRLHVPSLKVDESLSRQVSQPGIERQFNSHTGKTRCGAQAKLVGLIR